MHMYLISWLFVCFLYISTCVLFALLFVVAYFGWEAQGFCMQNLFRNTVFYELVPPSQNNRSPRFWGETYYRWQMLLLPPTNSVKKADMLHFTLQGISFCRFSLPFLSWFFISLTHSTRFWLLLASAIRPYLGTQPLCSFIMGKNSNHKHANNMGWREYT
jgi:hypothetical protein